MSSKKLAEFPDVEAKLQKPTRKSAFEQHKAEAAAKRQREDAETAAALKEFVKSFDRDDDDDDHGSHNGAAARGNRPSPARYDRPGGVGSQPAFGGSSGRRHFGIPSTPSGMKSGPGSLGPTPSGFGKKRMFEGPSDRQDREDNRGRLAFDDHEPTSISKAFEDSDDEDEAAPGGRAEEKAAAKPTLRLANLPPSTSPAVIKALIPSNLTVENVKFIPPGAPGGTDRKSTTAIVTLSKETAANDMDAAVSALQNRYLGFGFYLSLHRHLSSAAISSSLTNLGSSAGLSHPFGAKPVAQPSGPNGPSHMGRGRNFAPPSSYGPPGAGGPLNRSAILHVPVQPPKDIKRLRMIHKVIEGILQHGPEFEALLMSRPEVQKDEKWAWIWDARSEGGVWYRYRLWEIITGPAPRKEGQGKYLPLFEDSHAWKMPDRPLPYEYTTEVNDFVSDSEYNSSDDDDFDDEPAKPGDPGSNDQEDKFLNPLEKAKLTHLLTRLPTTLTKLRKGDIARVTGFAITHVSRGADEIVDMIISNVERPFSYTHANSAFKPGGKAKEEPDPGSREGTPAAEDKTSNEAQDTSSASLVGLYVVSDILWSSSNSLVRHAWRYRQLFEGALRDRKVFEGLGMLAEKLHWGRLRAGKWKRSVGLVLSNWEGWSVFPVETQGYLVQCFENPPSLRKEEKGDDDSSRKGKWKTMDATAAAQPAQASAFRPIPEDAVATVVDDADDAAGSSGEPDEEYMEYTDDEELDLEYLDEEDIDGEPILETGLDAMSLSGEGAKAADDVPEATAPAAAKSVGSIQMSSASVALPRKRLRAVDMFADSDSESNS